MLDHERLDVYQAAIQFLAQTHRVLARLPRGHAKLADQLQRASLSISVNIGEGTGKRSPRDRARFYEYSRGSAMECGALFDACARWSSSTPGYTTRPSCSWSASSRCSPRCAELREYVDVYVYEHVHEDASPATPGFEDSP